MGARRRRGDRRRGHHQRDHLAKADTVVQVAGLEELESELASGHGGAVVRLTVGRPSPAERGREKWRGSFTELGRCSCA